jgi:hypothetical protein
MQYKSWIYRLVMAIVAVILFQGLTKYANSQEYPWKSLQWQEAVNPAAHSLFTGNSAIDPGRLYATGLTNGVPATFTLPSVAQNTLFVGDFSYTITLPAGVPQLVVQLTSATAGADVDLFARFGQDVTIESGQPQGVRADWRSINDGTSNETITISAPQAGTYYIAFASFTWNIPITCTVTATYQGAQPSGPGMVIAQYVNGSGWTTALYLTNLSQAAESYTVKFYNQAGSLRLAPIIGFGSVNTISASLNPGQTVVYETSSTTNLESGWAIVTPTLQTSGLTGFAVFRFHTFGLQDSEAIVTLGNTTDKSLVMLYDQQNNFTTGLALVNPGATAITLNVTIRDQAGATLGTDVITLPAYSQQSSFVYQRYPLTLNRMGSLLITSSSGFAAVGLRFSPAGPFTSFPPLK